VNVFQQPCEEKPIGGVVCTWMVQFVWDCWMSLTLMFLPFT
jgi:hypothetical protein